MTPAVSRYGPVSPTIALVAAPIAVVLLALQISASGTYAMTTVGATFSYPTSCGLGNMTGAADVVAGVLFDVAGGRI